MEVKIEITEDVLRNLAESIQHVLDNAKEEPERDEDGEPDCDEDEYLRLTIIKKKVRLAEEIIKELFHKIERFREAKLLLDHGQDVNLLEILGDTSRDVNCWMNYYREVIY